MEVRRYIRDKDDGFAVSRVYEESWKHAYDGIIPGEYLDSIPKGRWAGLLDRSELYHAVMLEGGEIIGTSCFGASRYEALKNHGEIVSVYLLPQYIGKGYGKQLLEFTVNELKGLDYKNIFLWVLEENYRARGFYEAQRFRENGRSLSVNIGGKEFKELMYAYCV